jgi:hypothetical protein
LNKELFPLLGFPTNAICNWVFKIFAIICKFRLNL